MLCLKKVCADELLQLALLLSILRVNRDSFYDNIYDNLDYDNGTTWRSITPAVLRSHYVNPKSLDSVLLNYQRDLFADLNSLGRFNRDNFRHHDVTTYLLNIDRTASSASTDPLPVPSVPISNNQSENVISEEETNTLDMGINLTQEDMDLIEVLWKQDVDLGFTVDDIKAEKETIKLEPDEPTCSKDEDLEEKIKSLELLISENAIKQEKDEDPWAGINYTIDTETGEYVVKTEVESEIAQEEVDAIPLPLPEYYLDEALRVIDLGDERVHANTVNLKDLENLQADINGTSVSALDHTSILPEVMPAPETVGYLPPSQEILDKDPDDDFDFFNIIDTPVPSNPLIRTVSIEQRWHDLANLLNASAAENDHGLNFNLETAREVLLHNATLPTPIGDLNSSVPFSMFGGTSFRSPLSFLTNGSEPMGDSSSSSDFKLESLSDIGFYQNNSAEINQTDGFLSSMLNDEDLQLMDMALNEGMYTMRMLDGNTNTTLSTLGTNNTDITMSQNDIEHHDTSSDSAVSSMGSERAPSLSEGEWGDGSSDSGQSSTNNYMTDYPRKLRRYENSFNARQLNRPMESSDSARIPPVAQKKHQMFGKRIFQDQNSNSSHAPATSLKYEHEEPASSYTATNQSEGAVGPKIPDFKRPSFEFEREDHSTRSPVQHNHTYHLPAESSADMERPVIRDKVKQRRITTEEEHMSRDAKRAKALNVPMTVEDIVNLPMDEFNEKLSKYDLNEAQLSLIRDIRRRGKNKVAAQNCRKRKLDQILSLADEVKEMKDRKTRLINEHEFVTRESKRYRDKYQQLYRHVFQNLRDADGNPYSPYAWSLQTSADGSIILVPRSNSMSNTEHKDPHKEP